MPAAAHRATDRRLNGLRPESVFHLIGPSQVGLGSIAGIAMLHRLRGAVGVGIWPFDARERVDSARTVLVEAWPRMWLARGCRKNEPAGRTRQLARWAEQRVSFAPGAREAALSSADALDAAAAAIGAAKTCHRLPSPELLPPEALEREGWILGAKVG